MPTNPYQYKPLNGPISAASVLNLAPWIAQYEEPNFTKQRNDVVTADANELRLSEAKRQLQEEEQLRQAMKEREDEDLNAALEFASKLKLKQGDVESAVKLADVGRQSEHRRLQEMNAAVNLAENYGDVGDINQANELGSKYGFTYNPEPKEKKKTNVIELFNENGGVVVVEEDDYEAKKKARDEGYGYKEDPRFSKKKQNAEDSLFGDGEIDFGVKPKTRTITPKTKKASPGYRLIRNKKTGEVREVPIE